MKEWTIIKMGAKMFDLLHAYGLAVVLAIVGKTNILFEDMGKAVRLTGSVLSVTGDVPVSTIVPVPTIAKVQSLTKSQKLTEYPDAEFGNLDGLLSMLFTVPGVRAVSVQDLCTTLKPTVAQDALKKVDKMFSNWQRYIDNHGTGDGGSWINGLLSDYEANSPVIAYPSEKRAGDISVLMTIDPALGLSSTRFTSDGLVTNRTNIAIHGAKYATILAMIGAGRFLRTQRVKGKLVNFYVPQFKRAVIKPDTHMPPIPHLPISSDHALLAQTLLKTERYCASDFEFAGFAYQVMQTQGASQSISVERGVFDLGWITRLSVPYLPLIRYWRLLFETPPEHWPFEPDHLVTALVNGNGQTWVNHFYGIALNPQSNQKKKGDKKYDGIGIRCYGLSEIREILRQMNNKDTPLSKVMEYETGTLRFGRAMRLLQDQNSNVVRDILDDLNTVQNTDQLLRVLAYAVRECLLASARSKFMIVPDDDDVQLLLDDVDCFGAKEVAGLIILLSAVRYPPASPQIVRRRYVRKQKRPIRRPVHGKRRTNYRLRVISKYSDSLAST